MTGMRKERKLCQLHQISLEEMQESTSRLIYALLREERFGEKAKKGQ